MDGKKFRSILGNTVGISFIVYLCISGKLHENSEDVFEDSPPPAVLEQSQLKFEEVSAKLGIHFTHRFFIPNERRGRIPSVRTLTTMFPAVTVGDFDGDGFMDIYFSSGQGEEPNQLYHNLGGHRFEEVGARMGVADLNREYPSSFSVFADFNRDGKLDLLVGKWGCHQLFFGQKAGLPFLDVSEKMRAYCSNPNAIGVADLNQDGYLDLIFGNFRPQVDLRGIDPESAISSFRGDKKHGGSGHILFGEADGGFGDSSMFTFPGSPFTHSIGLTDLDHDGFPDILFANDYASDELYLNHGGKTFEDVTATYLPLEKHGFSSMNSEIFDYNGDGFPDLYITNGYKPPYRHTGNLLWQRLPKEGFREVAWEKGVARCGFAWAAKFADFDLDGEPDLVVLNGRVKSENFQDKGSRSIWYHHYLVSETPEILHDALMHTWRSFGDNFYMSAFEHSCLFQQKKGRFYDVALHAGLTDTENGRGLALIDYDNDGLVDLVVVNVGGPALLYHNVTPRNYDWMGFDLDGGYGHRIPFGAKLEFHQEQGLTLVREVFPTNGNKAQSDPRFVVGMGLGRSSGNATVTWADGKREYFPDLKKNLYNHLERGRGLKPE